jgi:hypothetical protein
MYVLPHCVTARYPRRLGSIRNCEGSEMKRLIAFLLLSPALASAQTPSKCALFITSGSMVFDGPPSHTVVGGGGPFVTSGPSCGGFTIDGNMIVPSNIIGPIVPLNFFPPGGHGLGVSWTNTTAGAAVARSCGTRSSESTRQVARDVAPYWIGQPARGALGASRRRASTRVAVNQGHR